MQKSWSAVHRAPMNFWHKLMVLFLKKSHKTLLKKLAGGDTLRSHRTLDGEKSYRLHTLTGHAEPVSPRVVRALLRGGFIASNQKFPVATFLLTLKGWAAIGIKNGKLPPAVRPSE